MARKQPAELDASTADEDAQRALRCDLRPGYWLQQGDKLISGPRRITLDEDTCRAHLHMFANCGELRKKLGIDAPQFTPRDEMPDTPELAGATALHGELTAVLPTLIATTVAETLKALGVTPSETANTSSKKTGKKASKATRSTRGGRG